MDVRDRRLPPPPSIPPPAATSVALPERLIDRFDRFEAEPRYVGSRVWAVFGEQSAFPLVSGSRENAEAAARALTFRAATLDVLDRLQRAQLDGAAAVAEIAALAARPR